MRMHYTSKLRKCLVQLQMSGSIRRRLIFALYTIAFHIDDHHVIRTELFVIDSARLDDKQTSLAVDTADIAPRIGDKSALWELHICFIHLFF
jgi:hypothetical protein